jgi:hypothetical protein
MEITLSSDIIATKENQDLFISDIIKKVQDGEVSALSIAGKIKFIKDSLDKASDAIKPNVVDELQQYDKRERVTVLSGYCVELKEMGVKYDYSNCGHPRYNEIIEQISNLDKERKAMEKFFQTLSKPTSIASEDTEGEIITIYPPLKKSTTTPVFTFSK